MDKVIYFEPEAKKRICSGKVYQEFLDYAFSKANYFMLVYINYSGKGYSKKCKYFENKLERFKVKRRTDPNWPGILETYGDSTSYKAMFYYTCNESKEVLKEVDSLDDWSGKKPSHLAFFIGEQCWFYSVGNESIAAIIHASQEDIVFLSSQGLAKPEHAFIDKDNYYDSFKEPGLI